MMLSWPSNVCLHLLADTGMLKSVASMWLCWMCATGGGHQCKSLVGWAVHEGLLHCTAGAICLEAYGRQAVVRHDELRWQSQQS